MCCIGNSKSIKSNKTSSTSFKTQVYLVYNKKENQSSYGQDIPIFTKKGFKFNIIRLILLQDFSNNESPPKQRLQLVASRPTLIKRKNWLKLNKWEIIQTNFN